MGTPNGEPQEYSRNMMGMYTCMGPFIEKGLWFRFRMLEYIDFFQVPGTWTSQNPKTLACVVHRLLYLRKGSESAVNFAGSG